MNKILAIIPTLNEEMYIGGLIEKLVADTADLDITIVITDGGSSDRTVDIAKDLEGAHKNVKYLHNPKTVQSAAVNLAAAEFGKGCDYLIRLDAHADYPEDYCQVLLSEAKEQAADSVVVAMDTVGKNGFQRAVAAAQNSKLGNGGSAHRTVDGQGEWVDHGHHALMRLEVFTGVGGYDEAFSHNEDAELDYRLANAGHKIWLTGKTQLRYYPRDTMEGLWRQYRNFGNGRAKTIFKHRMRPKLRQLLPVGVLPAIIVGLFGGVLSLPFTVWFLACLIYGVALGVKARDAAVMLSGLAAMVMHAAWSYGFWQQVLMRFMAEGGIE